MNRLADLAIVALAFPLLTGCARYVAEPLSASANAAMLETCSLDDARLREFIGASLPEREAGRMHWDLATLTLAALYFHPDLDISRSKLAAARAAVVTARQRPNP